MFMLPSSVYTDILDYNLKRVTLTCSMKIGDFSSHRKQLVGHRYFVTICLTLQLAIGGVSTDDWVDLIKIFRMKHLFNHVALV